MKKRIRNFYHKFDVVRLIDDLLHFLVQRKEGPLESLHLFLSQRRSTKQKQGVTEDRNLRFQDVNKQYGRLPNDYFAVAPSHSIEEVLRRLADEVAEIDKADIQNLLTEMASAGLAERVQQAKETGACKETMTVEHAKALYAYTFEFTKHQEMPYEALSPYELVYNVRRVFTNVLEIDPNDHDLINWILEAAMPGRLFLQRHEEWHNLLSATHAKMLVHELRQYTFRRLSQPKQLYPLITNAMRQHQEERVLLAKLKELICHINAALEQLWDSRLLTFRGISNVADVNSFVPGQTIVFPAFTSTSCDREVARTFSDREQSLVCILYCSRAKDISSFSMVPEEQEYLLPPNSTFVVRSSLTPMQLLVNRKTQMIELDAIEHVSSQLCTTVDVECAPIFDGYSYTGGVHQLAHGSGHFIAHAQESDFRGAMKEGRKHGWGEYVQKHQGWSYIGEWGWDLFHGKGRLTRGSWTWEGEFESGQLHGTGTQENIHTGSKYSGEWIHGQRHGYGTFIFPDNGGAYVGEWKRHMRWGKGTLESSKGLSAMPGCCKYDGQ